MIKLKRILRYKHFYKLLLLISLIYALLMIFVYEDKSVYNDSEDIFYGKIIDYKLDGDKLSLCINAKEKLMVTYYISDYKEYIYFRNNLLLGDYVYILGSLNRANNNTLDNTFNYRKYLYNNHIYYIVLAEGIEIKKHNDSVLYYIKNFINKRTDSIGKSSAYIETFLLADKSFMDDDVLISYQDNGIIHLFAVSGMHISLFSGFILFLMNKISYNKKFNYLIVFLFMLFYLFLTSFSVSVLRAFIMFLLFSLDKLFNLRVGRNNILYLVLVIVIFIDPFYLTNMGFQISYLSSSILIILSKKIKNIKHKLLQNLYVSFICFLISFPIIIYNYYSINFLSIFFNLLFIPLVTIIIFPLTILTFIFPCLDNICYFFISLMENFSLIISNFSFGTFILSKPNIFLILMYYIIILLIFYNFKLLFLFIFLLIIHKFSIYFDNSFYVTYMDASNGDSILIKFPYNSKVILLDSGGTINFFKESWAKRSSEYSLVLNKTIVYLKSLGISRIDYFLISHGDYDHMGEAINLVENFNVENVVFNCGEYNDLESELMSVLDKKGINYYSCIDILNVDNYILQFLNTGIYDDENDNSSVIYLNYNNYKFLFMGDAGIIREKNILDKYNISDVDFLKIGHHGSNTSSSEEFINAVSPKYSLISVGKNNRYGHPKKDVLDTLNNSGSIIYRTDVDGSIEIKINKNGYKIRTCSP